MYILRKYGDKLHTTTTMSTTKMATLNGIVFDYCQKRTFLFLGLRTPRSQQQ